MSPDATPREFKPEAGAAAYLNREMTWYDGQAKRSMYAYRGLSIAELVLAGAITVLAAANAWNWVITALGALVTVAVGVRGLLNLPDTYVGYRAAAETIRVEADLWTNKVEPYDGADADAVLIKKLAAIHGAELQGWLALAKAGSGTP